MCKNSLIILPHAYVYKVHQEFVFRANEPKGELRNNLEPPQWLVTDNYAQLIGIYTKRYGYRRKFIA